MSDTIPIGYESCTTLDQFFEKLAARGHISLVKVDEQGLVEPAQRNGAFVMQPRVRIVATAFDHKDNKILRWQKKFDVGSGVVTIHADTGRGTSTSEQGRRTREQVGDALKLKGYRVEPGEWTPKHVWETLAGLDNA